MKDRAALLPSSFKPKTPIRESFFYLREIGFRLVSKPIGNNLGGRAKGKLSACQFPNGPMRGHENEQ